MIYFDNAATSKPSEVALKEFERVSACAYGNANSTHAFGYLANRELEKARASVLQDLHIAGTHKLLFLSGASEANNLALKGVAFRYQNRGKRIISFAGEHPSVLSALEQLRDSFGFDVVILPLTKEGKADLKALEEALDKNTILVSAMAANNETGAINDVVSISNMLKAFPKAYLHVDATQAVGKLPFSYGAADLITFSAHKFGGLKGNGGLAYRKNISFLPLVSGGEQESGIRGGTVDVAGASAMAAALHDATNKMKEHIEKMTILRDYLKKSLQKYDEIVPNSPEDASPYIYNFSFLRHKASVVVEALSERDIYVSSVSACSSHGEPASKVLLAMGVPLRQAQNPIRVSMSVDDDEKTIDAFVEALGKILEEVRPL